MRAKRLTQIELARIEALIADGEITHNLPTIMRLVATVRHLESRLYRSAVYDGATFVPYLGTVN